ncbi:MAG TPA: galactokinase family protein [Herpetosiphonaceae bacterium]
MWQIDDASRADVADVADFVKTLNARADFFDRNAPVIVARAPGRLDVMGGIADYSGALVLQLPLAVATFVAAQRTDEPQITIRSLIASEIDAEPEVSLPLAALAPDGVALDYSAARSMFDAEPRRRWAAYVAGVLIVLGRERGVAFHNGVRLLIDSTVPAGKGVSSSAALEVATMQAICAAYDITLERHELALLCQMVENQVVGAPCGVMDQMASACGEGDRLLALLCQPAELQPAVALPADLEVWGIDSGIRHAVSGSDYGAVRVGAFMGYRIIAELAGLPIIQRPDRQVEVADERWRGYLANITPSLWESAYRDQLPIALSGAEFLARYNGTTDAVTQIDPDRVYAVRQPTAHPIYEHHRVQLFRALLVAPSPGEDQYALLGELMYQSHASYTACGLGSPGTDRLVELVRAAGPEAGLYGAKITGGGSGGTVAVLARRGASAIIRDLAAQYERETGHRTTILSGSSPGATSFGILRLSRQ